MTRGRTDFDTYFVVTTVVSSPPRLHTAVWKMLHQVPIVAGVSSLLKWQKIIQDIMALTNAHMQVEAMPHYDLTFGWSKLWKTENWCFYLARNIPASSLVSHIIFYCFFWYFNFIRPPWSSSFPFPEDGWEVRFFNLAYLHSCNCFCSFFWKTNNYHQFFRKSHLCMCWWQQCGIYFYGLVSRHTGMASYLY